MNESVKTFIAKNFGKTVYFYKHSDGECEVRTENGLDLTVNPICSIGEIIGYEIFDTQNQKCYGVLV